MKDLNKIIVTAILFLSLLIGGCGASNTVKGGVIGGVGGGVVGGVIGNQFGNTAVSAIIGDALGGTAGVLIGKHMDKQAEEIRKDIKDAKIERVGEGIKITFDSGILFNYDSATLQPEAKANINKLSTILKKYSDTNILIAGYTDSYGTESYDKTLSEKRAKSVEDYSIMQGVNSFRFSIVGLGEDEPFASNDTESGKRLDRRVEIAIFANDELKAAAESGKL